MQMTPTRELIQQVECCQLIKMIECIESRIVETIFNYNCDKMHGTFNEMLYQLRIERLKTQKAIINDKYVKLCSKN